MLRRHSCVARPGCNQIRRSAELQLCAPPAGDDPIRRLPKNPLADSGNGFMIAAMHSHSGPRRRWRRFNRKYGVLWLVACLLGAVIALVVLLMYMLTNPLYRAR